MAKLIEGEGMEAEIEDVPTPKVLPYSALQAEGLNLLLDSVAFDIGKYGFSQEYRWSKSTCLAVNSIVGTTKERKLTYHIDSKIPESLGKLLLREIGGDDMAETAMYNDSAFLTNLDEFERRFKEAREILQDLREPKSAMGPYTLALGLGTTRFVLSLALRGGPWEYLDLEGASAKQVEDYLFNVCTPSTQQLMGVLSGYEGAPSVEDVLGDIAKARDRLVGAWK